MLGQEMSLSCPLAVIRTLDTFSNVSPVERLVTLTFLLRVRGNTQTPGDGAHHFFWTSSHSQCSTLWRVLMNLVAPNLSATSWRYCWISLPGAYRSLQLGLGAKEYWYECAAGRLEGVFPAPGKSCLHGISQATP